VICGGQNGIGVVSLMPRKMDRPSVQLDARVESSHQFTKPAVIERILKRRPSVLALSTYPLRFPRDGGQLRAAAERAALDQGGFAVTSASIVTDGYPGSELDSNTIVVRQSDLASAGYPWVCFDLGIGRMAVGEPEMRAQFQRVLKRCRPDVIVLDQPWLWPVVEALAPGVPVVYSSQNVEHPLKEANLLLTKVDERVAYWVDEIKALETHVAKRAEVTVAVTDNDAEWLRFHGARRVFVAPNGTRSRSADHRRVLDWSRYLESRRIALFVASGHPPNAVGFWEMLGPSLGFLSPEEQVLAVGSVGPQLLSSSVYQSHRSANSARLMTCGFQEDSQLDALLEYANVALLPITIGEGSNLKTSEALVSSLPIVATSKAFRGFERFIDGHGVTIADSAEDFRAATHRLLSGPRSVCRRDGLDALFWPASMVPFLEAVRSAIGSQS
jgi:Glycosyl transferase 4-like domain/Glycosyl transferases group 1